MSEDVQFLSLTAIARQSFIDVMAQRIDASPAAVAKALDNLVSRGLVAASVDTHPQGGDPLGAPFMSGAVLSDSEAGAQPLPPPSIGQTT